MSTKTEGRHTAEFLISEANGTRSREQVTVTVPGSATLQAGLVLSKLESGKYVPYDNDGTDGSEAAAGVLYHGLVNAEVGGADQKATVIVRDAEVRAADLVWSSGVDESDQAAGRADLLAVGIVSR
jgi:hypothetical protein